MAEWLREFAALGFAEQRRWRLGLAAHYDRPAEERETLNLSA
jgi:hypothetical protein